MPRVENSVARPTGGGDEDFRAGGAGRRRAAAAGVPLTRRPARVDRLASGSRAPRAADLTLDEDRHEVSRRETQIPLTGTEFDLLRYFMLNPRRVLSKPQILQNVWRYDFGGNSNVVETYVSYLRKKLHSAGPPLIRTVRQAGYMLEADRG
ncbi:MAG: winged helix-turn-helix domain-containing protein [Gaiellaceae bacterium]